MSYKKRAIAAVLSAALMLTALTGCGSTASADSGDDGKVKIQYWHINSENQAVPRCRSSSMNSTPARIKSR